MTLTLLVVLCALVALVAAVRSTWSPCGLSMLSTITPFGETGRGHRYAATVAWFVAGAVLGGFTLGALMAGAAALLAVWDPGSTAVAVTVVVAAGITIASDLRLGGFALPTHPRQVNEVWLGRYRHWVYGVGFGWQIGVGLATYIMSAAVWLMVALTALTGRPLVALTVGTGFGLVRGLAVLSGWRLTTPDAMRAFHRRLESLAPWSLLAAALTQVAVLGTAAAVLTSPVVGAALGAVGAALAVSRLVAGPGPARLARPVPRATRREAPTA